MRCAILRVSEEFLIEALKLPMDVKIHGARMDAFRPGELELVVEHETLPDVPSGDVLRTVSATFQAVMVDGPYARAEFKGFK